MMDEKKIFCYNEKVIAIYEEIAMFTAIRCLWGRLFCKDFI